MKSTDTGDVRHEPEAQRFELDTPSGPAVADYERNGDRIRFVHTEVPQTERGRGLGGRLALAALEYARAEDLEVVPQCPFIAAWMRRHPEYDDLRAA